MAEENEQGLPEGWVQPDGWQFAIDDMLTHAALLKQYGADDLDASVRARLEFHLQRPPTDEEVEYAIAVFNTQETLGGLGQEIEATVEAKAEEKRLQDEATTAERTARELKSQYEERGFVNVTIDYDEELGEWIINGTNPVDQTSGQMSATEFNTDFIGPARYRDPASNEFVLDEPPMEPMQDEQDYVPPPLWGDAPYYTGGMAELPKRDDYDDYMAFFRMLDPEVMAREDDLQKTRALLQTHNNTMMRATIEASYGDPYEFVGIQPKYRQTDSFALFQNKSPAYKRRIQAQMIQAGLLDQSDIREFGEWTFAEAAEMEQIMVLADARGETWQETLNWYIENPEQSGDGSNAVADAFAAVAPYRAPDWATLKQSVKNLFRTQLGREPRDAEMNEFIHELDKDYRAAYDADASAARAAWYAAQGVTGGDRYTDEQIQQIGEGALDNMSDDDAAMWETQSDLLPYDDPTGGGYDGQPANSGSAVGLGGAGGGVAARQVDPFARFKERFEQMYEGELDWVQRKALTEERSNRLLRSMAGMSRRVGQYRG